MNKLSILFTIVPLLALQQITRSLAITQHDDVNKLYPQTRKPKGYCKLQLDLVLLVDESGSITGDQWNKLVPFLKTLIRSLNIGQNNVHLSLVTYSTAIRWFIGFLDPAAKDEKLALDIIDKLASSKPLSGWTYTGQALTFIREAVFKLGARKNAPKAIIIVTDGASTELNISVQVSSMLRDEGVTILVVGVGQARTSECRSIVGCPPTNSQCPSFVKTNWNNMISIVGGLMADVCETIPKDAVCNPNYSEWSNCSVKCGTGIRKKRLLYLDTIVDATIGSNGKVGRCCTEQKIDFPEITEECTNVCEIEEAGEDDKTGEEEDGRDDDVEPGEDSGNVPEPSEGNGGSDDGIRSGEGEEDREDYEDEDNYEVDDLDVHESHGSGEEESDDNGDASDSGESGHLPKQPEPDYRKYENHYTPKEPVSGVKYFDQPIIDYNPVTPNTIDNKQNIMKDTVLESKYLNKWKGENRSDYDKSGSSSNKNNKTESHEGNGTKIAGGVIGLVLLLGAGGGYMVYKRSQSRVGSGGDDVNGNFSDVEGRQVQDVTGGETYTVADLDDGLWGETN